MATLVPDQSDEVTADEVALLAIAAKERGWPTTARKLREAAESIRFEARYEQRKALGMAWTPPGGN